VLAVTFLLNAAIAYLCAVNFLEKYQVVIGLEVHAQLLTKSKLFCADANAFGADANTQVSVVSLAHPGTLPVMNKKVIELAIRLGLAMHCNITRHHYFARKNYFYPDLPKGYQVSQHTAPICTGGYLTIEVGAVEKNVMLNRIHMEEDAGKSIHDLEEDFTCVDLNRAGTPLLEIVTEPCLHSSAEAFAFLTGLRKLLRWLQVCDGNMEEGSMRCDANISIRLKGDTKLGTRVEVKNLNSIRNVKKAIDVEVERLVKLVENNETIIQETRSFNADTSTTFSLRTKEEADDYRYFPEPDLPAFFISEEQIKAVEENMPMLPKALEIEFKNKYGLNDYDVSVICADKEDADYFQELVRHCKNSKSAANWMLGPLKAWCNENEKSFIHFPLAPANLGALINYTDTGAVSFQASSTKLLTALIDSKNIAPETLAAQLNLIQESDSGTVQHWVEETLISMPDKVKEYRSGKKNLMGLFAGQVKKLSKGKADMQLVQKILEQELNK
jgi:aspartyl-tRNA(Asn)/glutamyl-tRNA(Gln) amidotransferase subunit B